MSARPRTAPRLAHHALQSLRVVRPFERVYAGQSRHADAVSTAVLIRQLLPGLPDDQRPATATLFERTSERLSRLTDPRCLPVRERLDAGSGPFYLVTDAPSGITLAELNRSQGLLDSGVAARIVLDVAEALVQAHRFEVLHLGLHRGSVLLGRDARPMILDLGLVPFFLDGFAGRLQRVHPAWDSLFPEAAAVAPEVIAGEALGPHTDVYGLGILAFSLLTGQLPYDGASMVAYNSIVAGRSPVSPRLVVPTVDEGLATLIARCLDRRPENRPSLHEVIAGLELVAVSRDDVAQRCSTALSDRAYLDRFDPILRVVDRPDSPEGPALPEPETVVPLFQFPGRSLSESELLARMSPEQRRIYLTGGSVLSHRDTRRTELRRGVLLGGIVAIIALLVFMPHLLSGSGGAEPDPAATEAPVTPGAAGPRAPGARRDGDDLPDRRDRRGLVLYY
ncbi:MAG: protein kinase [Myxococcales bacterium]|nr:protein kinase [Myxococcales bacterium]